MDVRQKNARKKLQRFEGVRVAILRAFSMLFDYIFDAILSRPLNLRKKLFNFLRKIYVALTPACVLKCFW